MRFRLTKLLPGGREAVTLLTLSLVIAVATSVGLVAWAVSVTGERNALRHEVSALMAAKDQFISDHTTGIDTEFVAQLNPEDVHYIINAERQKAQLRPLRYDSRLEASACQKVEDMIAKDYWAHDAPDGAKPWGFIKDQGVYYRTAGENLAYAFRSGDELVKGWMDSESHRANILKPEYTAEGLCARTASMYQGHSNQTIVVQHFIQDY